jgi:hypothetical protein
MIGIPRVAKVHPGLEFVNAFSVKVCVDRTCENFQRTVLQGSFSDLSVSRGDSNER